MRESVLLSFILSCALGLAAAGGSSAAGPAPAATKTAQAEEKILLGNPADVTLPVADQDELAFRIFQDMYDTTQRMEDQEEIRQVIIRQYQRIIREYPASGLAQEGHWKLIRIFLMEIHPPQVDKAVQVYDHLATFFPTSILLSESEAEIVRFWAGKEDWAEILRFTGPIVRRKLTKPSALPLYYYGEANYRLGRKDEAVQAFELAIKTIPSNSYLYKRSEERLVELTGKKTEQPALPRLGAGPGQTKEEDKPSHAAPPAETKPAVVRGVPKHGAPAEGPGDPLWNRTAPGGGAGPKKPPR